MQKERVIIAWSGGKDSALALREILECEHYEVAALLTTCTEGFRRISMHGVRCSLLNRQASALGIPVKKVFIPPNCSNHDYEGKMLAACLEFKHAGVSWVVFGDLFLQDIRTYRDRMLGTVGMRALYPIWGKETKALAHRFINDGFHAVIGCVDSTKLDRSFAGRLFDASFLEDLPARVDPCGENGEFHTFVFGGPIFRESIRWKPGPVVCRKQFYFADLLPIRSKREKP